MTDVTNDGGKTWKTVGSENLNAGAAGGKNAVWAVGPNGTIFRFVDFSMLVKVNPV